MGNNSDNCSPELPNSSISICLKNNIYYLITNISLYFAGGPPGEGLLVVEDEHVSAADLLEDGFVGLAAGDALVDVLAAPVPVLQLGPQLGLQLQRGQLLLLLLLLLLEHLEVQGLGGGGGGLPLLVAQVLVHTLAQDRVVLLGHGCNAV